MLEEGRAEEGRTPGLELPEGQGCGGGMVVTGHLKDESSPPPPLPLIQGRVSVFIASFHYKCVQTYVSVFWPVGMDVGGGGRNDNMRREGGTGVPPCAPSVRGA